MADAIMEDGDGGPNLQMQGAVCVLDELFRHFLALQTANNAVDQGPNTNTDRSFVVQCGQETSEYTCASYRAALSRGFRPIDDLHPDPFLEYDDISDGLMFETSFGVERYTNAAWYSRGTLQGKTALEIMSHLSSRRTPYTYSIENDNVTPLQQIVPPSVVLDINRRLEEIEEAGLFEDELESVNGLPSYHVSLVSKGENVVERGTITASVLSLVEPYIDHVLLPKVQKAMNSTSLVVSDIFLRKYGSSASADIPGRNKLTAHYDVFNYATAVIALGETASDGKNGHYAVLPGVDGEGGTSHAALRRYFPLSTGEAILHSWRVKHGVSIDPVQQMASLVVWFSIDTKDNVDNYLSSDGYQSILPPSPSWLVTSAQIDNDSVGQYVLHSAIESLPFYCGDDSLSLEDVQLWSGQELKSYEVLIKSASSGNSDALTRLGSLCRNVDLSTVCEKEIHAMLQGLRSACAYGRLDCDPLDTCIDGDDDSEDEDTPVRLARLLWFEAALRGNAQAQRLLGDEALLGSDAPSPESTIMASTLYALAAQQGHSAGVLALTDTIEMKGEI
jgi:hypothetical protein